MKTLNAFYMELDTISTNVTGTTLEIQVGDATGLSLMLMGTYDREAESGEAASYGYHAISGVSSALQKIDSISSKGMYQFDISGVVRFYITGTTGGTKVFAKVLED